MPYKIKKFDSGYKVCKKTGGKCFSKKPISKKKANRQIKVLYANESKIFNLQKIIEEILEESSGKFYAWMDKNGHIIKFHNMKHILVLCGLNIIKI